MKKVLNILLVTITVMALNSLRLQAQDKSNEDFYIGKWELMCYGLPQGDSKMYLTVEKKDGKLEGHIGDEKGENINPLSKATVESNTLTVNFTGGGYDVFITLKQTDEKSATGTMLDMFDVKGTKLP
jgi:hypothetical protein